MRRRQRYHPLNGIRKISGHFNLSLSLSLFTLFQLLSLSAFAQPLGYKSKIVFSSTSDWAYLKIINADKIICLDYNILVNASDSATVNCHGIYKEDTSLVSVEYLLFSQSIPAEGWTVESQKGDWGNVDFIFINGNIEPPDSMYSFTNPGSIPGDPTNTRWFSVPAELLTENGPVPLEGTSVNIPKKVCAFYYPWYGNPHGPTGYWFHWDPYNHYASTDTPLLGYYDSTSDTIVRQHMQWAKDYGIDVFISSWWGVGSFEDTALELILNTAYQEGIDVSIYLEASGQVQNAPAEERPDMFARELNYILNTYGNHPAFYKVDNVPVVFIYVVPLNLIQIEEWEYVLRQVQSEAVFMADAFTSAAFGIFDGCHAYSTITLSKEETDILYWSAHVHAHYHGKIFAATVSPGYDDRIIRNPGIYVPREDGAYYQSRWNIVTSHSPHLILITSWNEWHEGTEIEPSIEYGFDYLDSTKAYRDDWLNLQPGDVNGDGNINILDIILAVNFILGLQIPTPEAFHRADMNADGHLDILDVVITVNEILGG